MFPQVARYHKARTDKKEAYYLQQLQLFKPHRAEDVKKWEENPNTPYLESSKQIARVSSIVMENLESVQVKIDQTVFCSHLPENSFVMVQYKTVNLKYYIVFVNFRRRVIWQSSWKRLLTWLKSESP